MSAEEVAECGDAAKGDGWEDAGALRRAESPSGEKGEAAAAVGWLRDGEMNDE